MLAHLALTVRAHPLAAFFALTLVLSWWTPLLWPGTLNPFGPMLAALIVAPIVAGRDGVLDLLRRQTRWRVGLGWYAAALGLPVAVRLAAIAANVLLGAPMPALDRLDPLYNLLVLFPVVFILFGPLGEEFGFRGFALPRLLGRHSALAASLLLGGFVAVWHLPLVIGGAGVDAARYLPLMCQVVLVSVVYTWLFNNTGGSVLMVTLLHASNNTLAEYLGPIFTGGDLVRFDWLFTLGWVVVATLIVGLAGPARLSRRPTAGRPSPVIEAAEERVARRVTP
jgi:membrane protease YdiL (CAAX protease family)